MSLIGLNPHSQAAQTQGQAPQNQAAASNTGAAAAIRDIGEAEFMSEVIEASKTVPVIVDFWAPWCGPCKTLGPLLEKEVLASNGKVRMVKVDVDNNQSIAAQLRVQSIPTVYAFFGGRPVDGFQGAVPPAQIKEFVAKLMNLSGAGMSAEEIAAHLSQAQSACEAQDYEQALALYQSILEADPLNLQAFAGIAWVVNEQEGHEAALSFLADLDEDLQKNPELQALKEQLLLKAKSNELLPMIAPLSERLEANPDDHQAALELAQALAAAGEEMRAVDTLLNAIKRDRNWNDGAARVMLVDLFATFGPKAEATIKGRQQLSALLFA